MDDPPPRSPTRSNFRKFFVRGLAILLPTVLTIWILIAAYVFVRENIAAPINRGVQRAVLTFTPYPPVYADELRAFELRVDRDPRLDLLYERTGRNKAWLEHQARRAKLASWWEDWSFPLDLIGLLLAIVLIYMVGIVLGSFIGRRLYHRGERLIGSVPLIRSVYSSVKQITDFFVGEGTDRKQFSRVVAIEYPRKGMWSVGLVTGDTMRTIEQRAGEPCLTVFIPSSPTPFTGYVVTVMRSEVIDLPITIEEAMKFAVSGGVLIPPSQEITATLEARSGVVEPGFRNPTDARQIAKDAETRRREEDVKPQAS